MKKRKLSWLLLFVFIVSNVLQVQVGAANLKSRTFTKELQNLSSSTLEHQFLTDLKTSKEVKSSTQSNVDLSNPANYPLVNPGDTAKRLVDSFGTTQEIVYESLLNYNTDEMKLTLGNICDEETYKDPYTILEIYKMNDQGKLYFLGYVDYDLYGHSSVKFSLRLPKSDFESDEYLYLGVGVWDGQDTTGYSDFTNFKISNPFYVGPAKAQFAVVSNESIDGSSTESTGDLSIRNKNIMAGAHTSQQAYKMDISMPFNSVKYKSKLVKSTIQNDLLGVVDQVGDSKDFNVYNFVTQDTESLSATLLYTGTKANIWVNDNNVTATDAELLGKEFDNKIYSSVTSNFGSESDVDGNTKINILCYDIQDGFNGSGGYIAGYFDPYDLYDLPYSNKGEMFYIDTNPAMGMDTTKNVTEAYGTLAHEFQHMVNFNQNVLIEKGDQLQTWLDEGLSMAAEQIYTNQVLQDRIAYYNTSRSIQYGHSLLYWDYDHDTLANYSLSYLFMQYLKVQCKQGDSIFKEIYQSPANNYVAVETLIHKYIDPNMSFGQFMTHFRVALLLKSPTGLDGFMGITGFDTIQTPLFVGSSIELRGGGAIIKNIPYKGIEVPTAKGEDITYTIVGKDYTHVQGISFSKPLYSVELGKTYSLVPIFTPNNVTNKTITWNSNDMSIASVSDKGVVTGKKPGTVTITATTLDGNKIATCQVKVADTIAPILYVNTIDDNDVKITGKTEVKAKVYAVIGTKTYNGIVDSKGLLSITIPKTKADTIISVFAKDAYGNTKNVKMKVLDKTPPKTPTVSTIKSSTTKVTGKGEAGAIVYIYRGSTLIGKATVASNGSYKITIKKQKKGTKLSIFAKDKAGNKSGTVSIKVK